MFSAKVGFFVIIQGVLMIQHPPTAARVCILLAKASCFVMPIRESCSSPAQAAALFHYHGYCPVFREIMSVTSQFTSRILNSLMMLLFAVAKQWLFKFSIGSYYQPEMWTCLSLYVIVMAIVQSRLVWLVIVVLFVWYSFSWENGPRIALKVNRMQKIWFRSPSYVQGWLAMPTPASRDHWPIFPNLIMVALQRTYRMR